MNTLEKLLEEFRTELKQQTDQIGHFDDFKVLRTASRSQWIAILRDCNDNQKWRIQRFDKDGFIGHQLYHSKEKAIEAAARERFCISDDGALDRLAKTPAFQLGNEISNEHDFLNSSKITFKEFLARVSQLKQKYALA